MSEDRRMLLVSLPAVVSSGVVMAIAGAPRSLFGVQCLAAALMAATALATPPLWRRVTSPGRVTAVVLAAVLCALPLAGRGDVPVRWLHIGAIHLYIAPIVLPLCLVLCGRAMSRPSAGAAASALCLAVLALVLALQPDLSQVLALAAATAVLLARSPSSAQLRVALAGVCLGAIWLAARQPDPLAPVPYVEEVLLTAWRHSVLAACGVAVSAIALVGGLARGGDTRADLRPAAVYYAVLFACSIVGLTPAPLIGYGAGPLLGFGLLAGAASEGARA